MLEWIWPWCVLLLPLPWLVRHLLSAYQVRPAAIVVPFFDDLASLSAEKDRPAFLHIALLVLLWCSLVAAMARPVWYGEPVDISTSGRDLLLAIDISDSMRIDDMKVENSNVMRIDAVKSIASEFIQNRESDRIGLILFGQQAYLQTPLTFDRKSAIAELNDALPGFAGSSTAIGDAMGLAINLLRDRPTQSRVLILLSDGSNTYGSDPLAAVSVAAEADIKIHTIAIGATTHFGEDVIGQKMEINPSRDLDEQSLAAIADATGGRYFRAHNTEELTSIYATIDELEPAPAKEFVRPQKSLYHWPLAAALVCAILLTALRADF